MDKKYHDIFDEINETMESMGLNLFNVIKVYLPTNYFNVYKKWVEDNHWNLSWCGKPVEEASGANIIYFLIVER